MSGPKPKTSVLKDRLTNTGIPTAAFVFRKGFMMIHSFRSVEKAIMSHW